MNFTRSSKATARNFIKILQPAIFGGWRDGRRRKSLKRWAVLSVSWALFSFYERNVNITGCWRVPLCLCLFRSTEYCANRVQRKHRSVSMTFLQTFALFFDIFSCFLTREIYSIERSALPFSEHHRRWLNLQSIIEKRCFRKRFTFGVGDCAIK